MSKRPLDRNHLPPRTQTGRDKLRVKRRNIPVHVVFWAFALFLLFLFWKAFGGGGR